MASQVLGATSNQPSAGQPVTEPPARIRNQESAQAKVNDADGNPIEIAAIVVWQVRDTASAVYSVDDFTQFVTIQTKTAVRHIASSYPYDNRGSDRTSLRDNADEITRQLSAELTVRVTSAGVDIIESRLTRLSYAPEIAQAMLRQQQASAVVGVRCATSRRPSRSSTPARCTSDGAGKAVRQ